MIRVFVCLTVLVSSVVVWTPSAHAAATCTSEEHPVLAARLDTAIETALRGRTGTESVGVYDRARGITCWVDNARRFDSASVVKVTVLGTLLRRAMEQDRWLTERERSLAYAMITRSDNGSTSTLWRSLGRTRLQRFLDKAQMTQTTLGSGGYWGLTQITARDQIRLLRLLTAPNQVLNDRSRRYALGLMAKVVSSQRWGVPAGAPAGAGVHVKNGWLPRHGRYWRVHSIGGFDGDGRDYMIVVLTRDPPSMAYGVRTIERVARAVHGRLNPGHAARIPSSPPGSNWEISDGSVVPEPTR